MIARPLPALALAALFLAGSLPAASAWAHPNTLGLDDPWHTYDDARTTVLGPAYAVVKEVATREEVWEIGLVLADGDCRLWWNRASRPIDMNPGPGDVFKPKEGTLQPLCGDLGVTPKANAPSVPLPRELTGVMQTTTFASGAGGGSNYAVSIVANLDVSSSADPMTCTATASGTVTFALQTAGRGLTQTLTLTTSSIPEAILALAFGTCQQLVTPPPEEEESSAAQFTPGGAIANVVDDLEGAGDPEKPGDDDDDPVVPSDLPIQDLVAAYLTLLSRNALRNDAAPVPDSHGHADADESTAVASPQDATPPGTPQQSTGIDGTPAPRLDLDRNEEASATGVGTQAHSRASANDADGAQAAASATQTASSMRASGSIDAHTPDARTEDPLLAPSTPTPQSTTTAPAQGQPHRASAPRATSLARPATSGSGEAEAPATAAPRDDPTSMDARAPHSVPATPASLTLTALVLTAASVTALALLGAAAYTRLRRSALADHPLRSQVLALLEEIPGLNAYQLAKRMGTTLPGVQYHVRILAKAGMITLREQEGTQRLFVTGDARVAETLESISADAPRTRLLAVIARAPGASLYAAARQANLAYPQAHYHAKQLAAQGRIRLVQEGGVWCALPAEGAQ